MGEIAEMMLEGFLDEETGEVIDGESPGYPRRMSEGPLGFREEPRRRGSRDTQCPTCKHWLRGAAGMAQHRIARAH
jgi:hypothetical protein